jgi:transcriptional antiterminator Rof (Rho-off)
MGHLMDRCDVIDVLEESVTLRRPVAVELKGGKHFVDQPSDVVTDDHNEWVRFDGHEQIAVDDIKFCAPASPPEASYRGKT